MAQADRWWPGAGGGGRGLPWEGHEGTFQGDGMDLNLGFCGHKPVYSCQNSLRGALKIGKLVNFP